MMMANADIFHRLRESFVEMADGNNFRDGKLQITSRALSPREAIGNPGGEDYPILKGKESMLEATFRSAKGQAFTDMTGPWSGSVSDILDLEIANNFRRAVFVASLNAVMCSLGLIQQTIHCRDDGPIRCGKECATMLAEEYPNARVLLVGYQPRMLENLSKVFHLSVVDMDADNIGKQLHGVQVMAPEETGSLIEYSDVLLVTGTTLVNNTIQPFLDQKKPVIFYGVTIAGAAHMLGLRRFCPFGL